MRFLMLNWRDPRNPKAGGAERVSLAYLAALAQRGHEAWWFAPRFEGAADEEQIEGVRIVRDGHGLVGSRLAARSWFRRQKPFDLVFDQHHGLPWFAPWWCGTNNVSYIHEVLGPIWDAAYPWPLNLFGRWQERWTHWMYRDVPFFTASQYTKRDLEAHGVRSVTLIPYGVHTAALPELDAKPLESPLRLIVVSRMAPHKRIDHAVLTLKRLLDGGQQALLTIVGNGEEEARIRQLTSSLNLDKVVTFTGPLNETEKDAHLRRSHFLLHTSSREGWGLNVIEANAMGTPAAVYPVAGLVESTLHGETGLVADAETPEALAGCLANALRQPENYHRWRTAAWERAKTFHWSRVLPMACDWLEGQAGKPRS